MESVIIDDIHLTEDIMLKTQHDAFNDTLGPSQPSAPPTARIEDQYEERKSEQQAPSDI